MVLHKERVTVEDFDRWVMLPENAGKSYEFIGGEIVDVVSNPYLSEIASRIAVFVGMYLLQNDIGHLTGANGGYQVGTERYIPDAAFSPTGSSRNSPITRGTIRIRLMWPSRSFRRRTPPARSR